MLTKYTGKVNICCRLFVFVFWVILNLTHLQERCIHRIVCNTYRVHTFPGKTMHCNISGYDNKQMLKLYSRPRTCVSLYRLNPPENACYPGGITLVFLWDLLYTSMCTHPFFWKGVPCMYEAYIIDLSVYTYGVVSTYWYIIFTRGYG